MPYFSTSYMCTHDKKLLKSITTTRFQPVHGRTPLIEVIERAKSRHHIPKRLCVRGLKETERLSQIGRRASGRPTPMTPSERQLLLVSPDSPSAAASGILTATQSTASQETPVSAD